MKEKEQQKKEFFSHNFSIVTLKPLGIWTSKLAK